VILYVHDGDGDEERESGATIEFDSFLCSETKEPEYRVGGVTGEADGDSTVVRVRHEFVR
jgi:hypothetical protein